MNKFVIIIITKISKIIFFYFSLFVLNLKIIMSNLQSWEELARNIVYNTPKVETKVNNVKNIISAETKTNKVTDDVEELFIRKCARCGDKEGSSRSVKAMVFKTSTIPQCFHSFCQKCLDNNLLQR